MDPTIVSENDYKNKTFYCNGCPEYSCKITKIEQYDDETNNVIAAMYAVILPDGGVSQCSMLADWTKEIEI